jgi:hypothetical protein
VHRAVAALQHTYLVEARGQSGAANDARYFTRRPTHRGAQRPRGP